MMGFESGLENRRVNVSDGWLVSERSREAESSAPCGVVVGRGHSEVREEEDMREGLEWQCGGDGTDMEGQGCTWPWRWTAAWLGCVAWLGASGDPVGWGWPDVYEGSWWEWMNDVGSVTTSKSFCKVRAPKDEVLMSAHHHYLYLAPMSPMTLTIFHELSLSLVWDTKVSYMNEEKYKIIFWLDFPVYYLLGLLKCINS